MMKKKIKYLILILPLLFITNVNAECTEMTPLTGKNLLGNPMYGSVDSDTSFTANLVNNNNNTYHNFGRWDYKNGFVKGNDYIVSFDVVSIESPWDVTYSDFFHIDLNGSIETNLLENINSNTRHFKYKFNYSTNSSISFNFKASSPGTTSLKVENLHTYLASDYDNCINPTPLPTTYTYTFKVDNEVYSTGTVEEGTVVSLPENPTKEGYTFTGWTLNGESYTGGEIHDNIEIIANFEEIIQTPSESSNVNVDLSGIIPYLLLIAALIMLIILRDFIKSLFKSRR